MFEDKTDSQLKIELGRLLAELNRLDEERIKVTHAFHVLHGDGLSQLENNREHWISLLDREELMKMNMTRFYVEIRLIREELARRGVASE
jgi:hypothetical protein